MPTKTRYAGLNSDEWTNEPLKVIDQVLQNFFSSLASQSNMFYGQVESFAFYMQKNQGNPSALAIDVKQALTTLYLIYFNNVQINVSVIEADTVKREIQVQGTMDDTDGVTFDIGRAIETNNLNVTQILKLHNTGAA